MDQTGLAFYAFLKIMFDSLIFQGMYIAAIVGLITSAWCIFLPLNRSKEEKAKYAYSFVVSYGIVMLSSVFFLAMHQPGFHPLYNTGIILLLIVGGSVALAKYLQKYFVNRKQKSLDGFLNQN